MSVNLPSSRAWTARLKFNQAVPLLCLLASCLIGLNLIATKAYPAPFDELQHISYAAFLQETGRLLPKFEEQKTLFVEDMSRWSDRPNYLGHPSPFYLFIGLFLDLYARARPGDPVAAPGVRGIGAGRRGPGALGGLAPLRAGPGGAPCVLCCNSTLP